MGMITRIILRSLIAIVGVVAAAVGLLMLALQLGWARRHDAPEPQLHATTDPDVVARGRYLVYGPAACAYCHRPKTDWPALARGEVPPLSGGHEFPLPFGAIFSSNLTADRDTGIGAASDGTIARVLRYGVRRDGRAAVPIMEFQNLSDEDLVAVLSFLRTQPSVHQQPPPHRLTFFGRLLLGVLMTPQGPTKPPPHASPSGATVERGDISPTTLRPASAATPIARAAPWSARDSPVVSTWISRAIRRASWCRPISRPTPPRVASPRGRRTSSWRAFTADRRRFQRRSCRGARTRG
jgi:mono/diheme cytochrome c family protein